MYLPQRRFSHRKFSDLLLKVRVLGEGHPLQDVPRLASEGSSHESWVDAASILPHSEAQGSVFLLDPVILLRTVAARTGESGGGVESRVITGFKQEGHKWDTTIQHNVNDRTGKHS